MKQLIVFTASARHWYMSETLASWSQVRGIGDCWLGFYVEPGCAEMAQVCESVDFAESYTKVNPVVLGVQRNPFEALNAGFRDGADFVVLAEDDLVVSTDVLEWLSWGREKFAGDSQVLAVTANQFEEQPGGPAGALKVPWFHCWVWGTWRDRWEGFMRDDWTFSYEHRGWDWRLNDYWVIERGMRVVAPCLSRSQHIGKWYGSHTNPAQFEEQQSHCFLPDIPPQEYFLIDD